MHGHVYDICGCICMCVHVLADHLHYIIVVISISLSLEGVLLPHNVSLYGRPPQNSIYYSNFCAPDNNTFSIDNCSTVPSINLQCRNGSLDIVLQCSRGICVWCFSF